MFFVILPIIYLVSVFPADPSAEKLADFTRFARVQGEEIAVVDMFGAESLGRVVAASETSVTLGFGQGTREFDRTEVFKADRLRDGAGDGLVKGMLVGAVLGLAIGRSSGDYVFGSVGLYGGLGLMLDLANTNRSPVYRK